MIDKIELFYTPNGDLVYCNSEDSEAYPDLCLLASIANRIKRGIQEIIEKDYADYDESLKALTWDLLDVLESYRTNFDVDDDE